MSLKSLFRRTAGKMGIDQNLIGFRDSTFTGPSITDHLRDAHGYEGDLAQIFAKGSPQLVDKWHHYLPLYDRYFAPWRNKPLRFLEIGVSGGGSLTMWRKFFGPQATIFGIDIDPACAAYDGIAAQVRIGSQDDPAFLASVVAEMGGVDIVLDDGSHQMAHLLTSFRTLFPLVQPGGLYFIEDLHTAYWPSFGGGYDTPENFFTFARSMIDDMHHWYHNRALQQGELATLCTGLHIHDSICVFDRNPEQRPVRSTVQAT